MDDRPGTSLSEQRPFPGLRPFEFEDRPYFFGREDQIYALYRLLDYSRFIAVVGSSGSGKSSLVRAGLLPLLAGGTGEGGGKWRCETLHPGDAPMTALGDALARLANPEDGSAPEGDPQVRRERIAFALRRSSGGIARALDEMPQVADKSILLVIDQFEELFRFATSPSGTLEGRLGNARWRDEVTNFVQLLLQISRDRSRSCYVLITMRSDFIGDCARFYGLPEAVSGTQFLTPSLTRDQREEVIRKPIEKAKAEIEPALVERLLNDASDEMDQLPVLQHCLLRVWNEAGRDLEPGAIRRLSRTHYEAVGTIAGALSQHADEVMNFTPGAEHAIEQVFRALSERDKEGRATRRAIRFRRLLAETGLPESELRAVVERFRADDCSFILPSPAAEPVLTRETRIDVVHEALLRRWEKISGNQGWLAKEEFDGRRYRALLAILGA